MRCVDNFFKFLFDLLYVLFKDLISYLKYHLHATIFSYIFLKFIMARLHKLYYNYHDLLILLSINEI